MKAGRSQEASITRELGGASSPACLGAEFDFADVLLGTALPKVSLSPSKDTEIIPGWRRLTGAIGRVMCWL